MPGPPGTESRWAPAIATGPLRGPISAITFRVRPRVVLASTVSCTRSPSRAGTASLIITTGMPSSGTASVALGTPRREAPV